MIGCKRLHQLHWKKAGAPRQIEETECKEAIDAFGVSGNQECPFHVARRLVGWLFKQLDPVRFNQLGKNLLVAVLFPGIQQRSSPACRQYLQASWHRRQSVAAPFPQFAPLCPRSAKRLSNALQLLRVQFRPNNDRRSIGVECFAEHGANRAPVGGGARTQRSNFGADPLTRNPVGRREGLGCDGLYRALGRNEGR